MVSDRCKDLVYRLIQDKHLRLCSKRYQMLDRGQTDVGRSTDIFGRYVFPDDAEDIKAHRWFKNIPWERLQTLTPPFVPQISNVEDTHYFDESEPIEDMSNSSAEVVDLTSQDIQSMLRDFRPSVQNMATHLVSTPYDSGALRSRDYKIDSMLTFAPEEKEMLKRFVRQYGKKVPKRPRDIILRDEKVKEAAMDVRRQTAFMGYTWRRIRPGGYMMPKWVA
ncbi:Serine/threonine-protein kinase cbk1-like protein [Cladobotryum mycophilum]|uniref:Serine/threonine-protein kinase cbk1-like protein n=1 Tax=Cladobotryum mycophilum TaxID=491253 RepID=A0ABR0SFE6_9HYPO